MATPSADMTVTSEAISDLGAPGDGAGKDASVPDLDEQKDTINKAADTYPQQKGETW